MTNKFKVGDRVKCVKPIDFYEVREGNIYEVFEDGDGDGQLLIDLGYIFNDDYSDCLLIDEYKDFFEVINDTKI